MNSGFPPLGLPPPINANRRPEKPRVQPLPPELLSRRAEIARVLGIQIDHLSSVLRQLSDEQRRAIFYKIEHNAPVSLSGTGLKEIAQPTPYVTLAIPRENNLDKFAAKIQEFGTGKIKRDRSGRDHAPNEGLALLTKIQLGDPTDRLSEELSVQYETLIKQDFVICEIEILSLKVSKNKQRQEIQTSLVNLQREFAAGVHGTLFEHEEIKGTCRAVIRCTGKMFKHLVEDRKWQTRISWFEPRPRFETFHTVLKNFHVNKLGEFIPPTKNAPVVCIVDTGVSSGNPFLKPVTREDLFRSFLKEKDNPYDEYGHGSGVASLASYYALNLDEGAVNQGKVWIASARILNEHNALEDDRLFSAILREVVNTFVPLGVRIFNLSIGDVARKWNPTTRRTVPRNSWVARTIDQLSREKDIIFITCTGNISAAEIKQFQQDKIDYPVYLLEDESRILDPGQAALALTVGSIVPGMLVTHSYATAIAEKNQASPFTRSGPGIRKEIKPELVEYGGNLVYDQQGNWIQNNLGTNVILASHKLTPAIAYDHGTSYAAPRVANKLAIILSDLHEIGLKQISSALLKAFIVNSATYPREDEIRSFKEAIDAKQRKAWLNILGYGIPSDVLATYCDEYSAILFYQGELKPDQVAYFQVPIPACLQESDKSKRLTVTIVHTPEVQRWGLERYLGTDLKWRMFRGDVEIEDIIAAMSVEDDENEADNSEDESETSPLKELKFNLIGINRRSRGVIQHDTYEWIRHRQEYSDNHYTLAIAAYKKWNRDTSSVPYAVVIRLEDTGHKAKVYTAIQSILTQIEAQTKARR